MALVKFDESWSVAKTRKPRIRLPPIKHSTLPVIDYDKLKALCAIEGLATGQDDESTPDAHQAFMQQFRSIFTQPSTTTMSSVEQQESSLRLMNSNSTQTTLSAGSVAKSSGGESGKKSGVRGDGVPEISHEIRDHTSKLHRVRNTCDEDLLASRGYKQLRRLLRKLPFERTMEENDQIFEILKTQKYIQDEVPRNAVRNLCTFASLDVMAEAGFTVFGNQGLHLVLKGSVRPQTDPYLRTKTTAMDLRRPTPLLEDLPIRINVGGFFGSLRKIEGRESNSKILSVITCEANCEFLKISSSDYAHVIEQIENRDQTEKVNLLLPCENYRLWPRQSLLKVAELIDWISYPPNTVLVGERYTAPYIGIIKSGECHVLRQLEVVQNAGKKQQTKRVCQVVMGKLVSGDSFGEISVLCDTPITCTIVSASDVTLGIIKPYKLRTLDETTTQLLVQSNVQTYGHLSKDEIEKEYMRQERKREWNDFKHTMVMDVIKSRGIQPGYGKWSK